MYRTFNMGVGLAAVVGKGEADAALRHLARLGQKAWIIGELSPGAHEVVLESKKPQKC